MVDGGQTPARVADRLDSTLSRAGKPDGSAHVSVLATRNVPPQAESHHPHRRNLTATGRGRMSRPESKSDTRSASTGGRMADSFWYPSVEDVLAIHDDIVSEYAETHAGVQNRGDVEFALNYVDAGSFGTAPKTIHETAFHLLRLLVANHPFVDANKRTALNTTVVFYVLNGSRFEYDEEIRSILKRFGTVDEGETVEYLASHTDLAAEIEQWRDDLVRYGLAELTGDATDRTITPDRDGIPSMVTEEDAASRSPLDGVMEDIRRELVQRVAAADRDVNREIYDALETE
jgi:death-on-curing protein